MNALPQRSTLVTVVAWVFIGLAGFATFIAILQNIMFEMVFAPALQQATASTPSMPAPVEWMSHHIAWVFRAFLLLALATLTSAIGLLLRKNWARLLFIGLLALAVLYQFFGLVVQWWMGDFMQEAMAIPPHAPQDFERSMQAVFMVMRVFGMLLALGLSTLFAWLIYRLSRPAVIAEFGVATNAAK